MTFFSAFSRAASLVHFRFISTTQNHVSKRSHQDPQTLRQFSARRRLDPLAATLAVASTAASTFTLNARPAHEAIPIPNAN